MAAAAAGVPLDVRQVFTLPALGIDGANINIKNTTMSSDAAVCVREIGEGGAGNIAIVDLGSGRLAPRKPLSADAAILSPDGKLVAVRGACSRAILRVPTWRVQRVPKPLLWSGETMLGRTHARPSSCPYTCKGRRSHVGVA